MDFLAALLVSACVFDQILWHEIIRIAFLYPLVTNEKRFLNEFKGKQALVVGVVWISSLSPTVLFFCSGKKQ